MTMNATKYPCPHCGAERTTTNDFVASTCGKSECQEASYRANAERRNRRVAAPPVAVRVVAGSGGGFREVVFETVLDAYRAEARAHRVVAAVLDEQAASVDARNLGSPSVSGDGTAVFYPTRPACARDVAAVDELLARAALKEGRAR